MINKVCPNCGSEEFTQRRSAVVEARLYFDPQFGWSEIDEEIIDTEGLGDSAIVCDDCGDEITDDELVTPDEYNESEDV